jgi:hypothetical protein
MKNTISLKTAQDWALRWKEAQSKNQTPQITAFTIPGTDVSEALKPEKAVNVRTYMGIDETSTPRLIIVAVDKNGNDLIDDANGYYIYDFTQLCPPNCNGIPPFIAPK